MSGYRLLKHRQYEPLAKDLPETIRKKALWAQVLLGTRGRTPNVKSTSGYNARWRRTPVQGYHYYLWWIPLSESELAATSNGGQRGQTILVYGIRHHDETDDPINLISLDEFEEVPLLSMDPRYDEQQEVGRQLASRQISLATVKGLPGSGKTISLFYLVRDLLGRTDTQNVLYVTYTSRLKRAAREFLFAHDPELERKVKVRTLTEIEKELTGLPVHVDPFGELADFERFLETQSPQTLRTWKRYPATLYTELRAHILGRTFPVGYQLPASRTAEATFTTNQVAVDAYGSARGLSREEADLAWRLAERLRTDRFFLDQKAALAALDKVRQGKPPAWLRNIDALIVDEVQDLTLLQIALLAEVARMRLRSRPDQPLAVAVAGDESQIVQPSGFDWGTTKDLLRVVLGANPTEFEFRHQRRSPRNLARLIDNSWNFYGHLPKPLRPSANRQSFVDDAGVELSLSKTPSAQEDDNGRMLICALPPQAAGNGEGALPVWRELVEVLAALPGRALIDLSERVLPALAPAGPASEAENKAGEVVFLAREIKGLERSTVLVHGLNDTYKRAMRLVEDRTTNIAHFEARRLIDEMRVALSRSTDKLVILEAPDAPVLKALELPDLEGYYTISWDGLLELLRTEEMSEIEVVEGYLDEVDDLLERGRWEQARQRNRRAKEFAMQIGDRALLREAEEQYIQSYLQEAESLLSRDRLREAYQLNRRAYTLAEAHADPAVLDEVDEQRSAVREAVARKVNAVLAQAASLAGRGDVEQAYQTVGNAGELLAIMHDASLQATVDEAAVAYGWQLGLRLVKGDADNAARLVSLFTELGEVMARQQDRVGTELARVVAERYRTLPHHTPLTPTQIGQLLEAVTAYLERLGPLELEHDAYAIAEQWLEEAFLQLGNEIQLYYNWALVAQGLASVTDYPVLDERLWDLENRAALIAGDNWHTDSRDERVLRFAALIAAYNEEAAKASHIWEQLGEIQLAADKARAAGDVERAYNLLRQSGAPIPEELSIAVKLLRLADQLQSKHARLTAAERRALAETMDALAAILAAGQTGDNAATPPADDSLPSVEDSSSESA